jgi:exodeoxyribonuclease V beta subunit
MTTSTVTDTTEFDLLGPLPAGTTILEASAGTGKTYAIAGLVVRYVVEADIPLPSMLVVTFTRAATAELRDRVRDRLVGAADHLAAVLAGAPATHPDAVLAELARDVAPAELRQRYDRAARAIADFDAATISTIHGFCQQVLRTLGLAVDADPGAELVADQSDLVNAVVDDLLIQFATRRNIAEVSRSQLLEIAQKVVSNPDARIVPDPHRDDDAGEGAGPDIPTIRAELAHRIRTELDRRKRARRLLSYDDLLTQLRDALTDPVKGEQAAAALRDRYRVALIDEFQDTDPVQWDILRGAFAVPGATLVLIGDPKQAIYSFRGADVHAYLDAVAASDDKRTLPVNWRSDGPLLRALDTLLDGATFGDPRIAYLQVRPAPGHEDARITGGDPPLRLRCVPRSHGLRGSRGDVNAGAAREHIAADLAAQTVELLSSDTRILAGGGPAADATDGAETARPVSAGDIAVLVRTNAEAVQVHRALRDVQVPAIINGVGSVFETPAATEWRRLLEALEQPANGSRARALALTSFLGWSGERIATADEDDLAQVHDDLHEWAQILRDRGVASLFRTITVATELPERLLGLAGGERHLTDLEHLGQLLHRAAVDDQLGPASLTSWLVQAIAETDDEQVAPEERARRLESDARAVQILTVHRSKGLQYPIVLAPYLWSAGWLYPAVPTFHDAGGRAIDVGGKRDDEAWEGHHAQALDEQFGEGLRLLYVALTRAEHQVVVWWSPCRDANKSGLGRVLFARDLAGTLDTTATGAIPNDERCNERLGSLAARSDGTMRIEETDRQPAKTPWQPPADEVDHLSAAQLSRPLDRAWHRTSYSRITAHAHQPLVGSEPAEDLVDDEELLPTADDTAAAVEDTDAAEPAAAGTEAALRAVELPLSDTPGGAEFGTFVHAVLEDVDFAADDLRGALREQADDELDRRRTRIGDVDALVEGLARAVETPLGPLAGGRRLRDLTTTDRLNELDFELPLDPRLTGAVTVDRIAALLREHLPADDPLAGYAAELEAAGFDGELRGFLTGSIDLVVRVPGADGVQRYLVADHKTNRLGTWGQPITAWDYRPAALPEAMTRGHYPLQALLYQVALHRYLRWRLPDYDPAVNLGGALYLFLRGMAGDDTPQVDGQPCGVFAWEPPPALVVAISDLLDGGAA